jgi:hypothetical protein
LIYWTKPGGKIFIQGMFNPYDIDVFVKYRESKNYGHNNVETGWNIISQKTITNILNKNNISPPKFHKFNISLDIEKNNSDSVRSWTEKKYDGTRYITNGLCLLQPQYTVEITSVVSQR